MDKPEFSVVLAALLDETQTFPPQYLYQFSDLTPENLQALLEIWPQVGLQRRRALLEDLEILAEADTLLSFDDLAFALLEDSDSVTRMLAIRLLWENQDKRLIPRLLHILREDEDHFTRAAAAAGLSMFVYLGDVGELDEDILQRVETYLLYTYYQDKHKLVRRRALEALGYSGRPEVNRLIAEALSQAQDVEWLASALFAIGRTFDVDVWHDVVLEHLEHYDTQVRLEAIHAAGKLNLSAARQPLLKQLSTETDADLREALIWALGRIGGPGVRQALETLYEQADEASEEAAFVREALDQLDFNENVLHMGLMEVDPNRMNWRSFDPEEEDFGPSWEDDWLFGADDAANKKD